MIIEKHEYERILSNLLILISNLECLVFSLTPITKNLYTSFIPGKRDGLTINMKHRHKALLKVHFYARYFTYDMIGKNEEFSCSHTPFASSC